MADIIAKVGPLGLMPRRERFPALVRAIIFQQLAGAAARAIHNRFVDLYPETDFPTPELVLATPDTKLRKAGLSPQKISYIRDLAEHVRDGKLNFHRFARMTDDEVVADLTRVKGIGRWTAEMFLIFNLGSPDVFPVDDFGIQKAVKIAYRMRAWPKKKQLAKIGERMRPYRSAATWYLWRSLDITLPEPVPKKRK
ncbi:MAG TPA: DNA-3-methyladenine glycosylase [Candidatus Binataceae bacterium]|nr:DNA-3-methyladenine glycosylase [Candidatus Binataceae bacterium]